MFKFSIKATCAVLLLTASTLSTAPLIRVTWPYSTKQVRCLVDNVYHEARGESFLGQTLVARVTLNRAQQDDTTICTTVYQPNQFSWTKKTKPINRQSDEYYVAWHAAYAAIGSSYKATYYHSIKIRPKWAKKLTRMERVGNHIFYK